MLSILRGDADTLVPDVADLHAWERLLVSARDTGHSGLLNEELSRGGHSVPADFLSKLVAEAAHVAAANRILLQHLERLAAASEGAGIDMLVLKGAALLGDLYVDLGLRPMCDIDLLIKPDAADAFDRLLLQMGYERGQDLLRDDFYPRFHYEREYIERGPRPVRLDVHVRPFRPLRYSRILPPDALWDGTRTIALKDAAVRVPSVTNMTLHLVCHAAFHGAERLLWLADIHRFVARNRDSIDWELLLDRLRVWNLSEAARLGFARTEGAFGRCIPDDVREALAGRRAPWRDRLALWQAPRDAASPLMHTLVDLLCTSGWRYRAGYLAAVVLPDATHLAEGYRGRHIGWQTCAHFARAWRKVARTVTPSDNPSAPRLCE